MPKLITPEIMQEAKKLAHYEDPRYSGEPFFLEAEMLNHEIELIAENMVEELLNEVDTNAAMDKAKQVATNVGNTVNNVVSTGVDKAKEVANNVANNPNVQNAVNTAKQTASNIGNNLKATIQAIIKWIVEKLTNFRKLFTAAMGNINKRIEANINKINPNGTGFNNTVSWYNDYNNIKATVDKLIEISNNVAQFDISTIISDQANAANNITNLFTEFEGIKNNIKNILAVKAMIANQANELNGLDSLKTTAQDIFNTVTNIDKAIENVNNTLSKANNLTLDNNNGNEIKQLVKQYCNNTLSLVNTLKIISINFEKTLLKAIMGINEESSSNQGQQQPANNNNNTQQNNNQQQQQTNQQNNVANECTTLLEYVSCLEYGMNKILLEVGEQYLGPSVTKVEPKTGKGNDMGASNSITNVSCNATYEQALNKLFYNIHEDNNDKYDKEFEKMMKDSTKSSGSNNNDFAKDLNKSMKLEVADQSSNGTSNNSYLK